MPTIKLPAKTMQNILWEQPEDIVEDKIVETTRWSVIHEIVFKYEGKHYRTDYSEGATECQDESPWEYVDEVEADEVEQVPVTVMQWQKVKESE